MANVIILALSVNNVVCSLTDWMSGLFPIIGITKIIKTAVPQFNHLVQDYVFSFIKLQK